MAPDPPGLARWARRRVVAGLAFLALALLAGPHARGQDAGEQGAASVHLRYRSPPALAFYSEVTVRSSAPQTYFAVAGWHSGYFGLQELTRGRKQLIFSVWDSPQTATSVGPADPRVTVVYKDDAVRVGRFGNEGSGGQSFLRYDWKPGVPYAFMVKARAVADRAEYSAFFRAPDMAQWRHLVTFSTPTLPVAMSGLYAFIEDFARTPASAEAARQAEFGNGWVRVADGTVMPLLASRFTTTPRQARAVDAGVTVQSFTLTTGGPTGVPTRPQGSEMERPAPPEARPPEGL